MLKRSLSLFLVFCTVLVLLTGCAGSQQSSNPTIQETKNGEYILTTENGIITMFDNVSNVLAEVDLNAGEDSKQQPSDAGRGNRMVIIYLIFGRN